MSVQSLVKSRFPDTYEVLRKCAHPIRSLRDVRQTERFVRAYRANYERKEAELRARPTDQPIRVVFLVNEINRWKAQSLYDALKATKRFQPVIALTLADADRFLSDAEARAKQATNREWFEAHGMPCVDACEESPDGKLVAAPLERLSPDIVVYQQPWTIAPCQMPEAVSKYALTAYISYYVLCYGKPSVDTLQRFHRTLHWYFMQSEEWAKAFRKFQTPRSSAAELLGLGHTMLDQFHGLGDASCPDGYTIYAPHFSFFHPNNPNFENYSTILQLGRPILAYAQAHPEMNWVFKPHPRLKLRLVTTGAWTQEEVDAYWEAWAKVGKVAEMDYVDLFRNSRAMVTDCSSFLAEYPTTGRPLIRLISGKSRMVPMAPGKKLFRSFYSVHTESEMNDVFRTVLEEGKDPMREERWRIVRECGLLGVDAARNIVDFLTKTTNRR